MSRDFSRNLGGHPTGYLSIPRWGPPRKKKKEVFMSEIEKMKRYIERTNCDICTLNEEIGEGDSALS